MPLKDKAADREYHRDLMRRRRADAAAALLTPFTQQGPPAADRRTPGPQDRKTAGPQDRKTAGPQDRKSAGPQDPKTAGPQDPGTPAPQDQGKCVWSDKDICILFLSQDLKPIRCYGFIRICEGKPDAENTIPFKPCRENNDKTQQLAL